MLNFVPVNKRYLKEPHFKFTPFSFVFSHFPPSPPPLSPPSPPPPLSPPPDYNCGSPANWSHLITVTTLGNSSSAMVLAVYGDLGTTNDVSLPSLISDVDQGLIQGVLHVGDMAYDMYMVSTCKW